MKLKNKIQNIILILSDGREIVSSVPAFCDGPISIINIKITEPVDMPEGFNFEKFAMVMKDGTQKI